MKVGKTLNASTKTFPTKGANDSMIPNKHPPLSIRKIPEGYITCGRNVSVVVNLDTQTFVVVVLGLDGWYICPAEPISMN